MKKQRQKPTNRSEIQLQNNMHLSPKGTVLVYVVVLMLIFGILGVVMVSLFTSSIASSRMRFAFSELRKADFDLNVMIDPLNTTTYTVTDGGSFTINVFSPWFESSGNQSIVSSPPDLALNVPIGAVPVDYTIPISPNTIYAVNYEFVDVNPTASGISEITGYTIPARPPPPTTLTLALKDDFNANLDERVVFAVQPAAGQDVNVDGVDLDLPLEAQYFLPKYGGAISIRRNDYFYEQRKEEPEGAPTKVVLTNLSKAPQSEWLTTQTNANDWVILSPRNFIVVPTGQSDGTTYGGDYAFGGGIYDSSLIRPGSAPPDITADDLTSNLSEQETDTRFFEVDTVADTLRIGRGLTDQFGSALYAGDESIGGDQDYCQQGACLLALGVRAFFLVNFSQQGEGITFTLLGKGFPAPLTPNNSASSVGGDFELSELMGYAGDSRLVANADPLDNSDFLATNEDDRGLDPPKIAVEFDTRTNNAAGDPPPDYCSGADANADTRNDPLASNKDAVQYVFWGRTGFLNIPCRDNNTLYDDNRHDADGEQPTEEWRFGTAGIFSFWRPAIGSDGTIYMSARDSILYALNEDGTEKWTFPLGDNNEYMPGIDRTGGPNDGTIYSDVAGNSLLALNPDGSEKWRLFVGADVDSTPVVDSDGTIYFVTGDDVDGVPSLSPDASVVYVVSNDDNLYAVNTATGAMIWSFPIGADGAESGELNSSSAVDPNTGIIYVGSDDHNVYAVNPNGTEKWRFTTGADIESSPTVAIDPIDGRSTVYIGSDDDNVYALDAETGAKKWEFATGGPNVVSSPVVDLDGTIYVGSEDGNVYAINPDGTEKWNFPTGDQVRSSPAIGQAGFIHIGSNDTNFYTISQFADPRNFKDADQNLGKLLTSAELDSSVLVNNNTDWLNGAGSRGSWAVRLEVDRALLPNVDGKFDYELRLWMRQCFDQDDTPCDKILGTFYQDTRIEYDYTAVEDLPMRQSFSLSGAEQDAFESFFFGFTGAAGAEALDVAPAIRWSIATSSTGQ
jgi:outer membrane protein assembly factor BamB